MHLTGARFAQPFRRIREHLARSGWRYSPNDDGYDRELALFPEDVLGWLADSQPEQLEKVVRPASTEAEQEHARQKLLRRLRTALDLDPAKNGGVLHVLRNGFSELSAKFQMAQFKPATGLNPAACPAQPPSIPASRAD